MTVDLRTRYLGLELANPLVVAACPLVEDLDTLRHLEAAGAAAAVLPSLFEEQIVREELELHGLYEFGTDSFAESLSYIPPLEDYRLGTTRYLDLIREAKRAVSIPIIGSLNGTTTGGWTGYAKMIEDAGADALELNIYVIASRPDVTAEQVEAQCIDLVAKVRSAVRIPLAVKLTPFFTALANFARRLEEAGADGLVLFNRFVHPDADLDTLELRPDLRLSRSYDARLPLTWIGILRPHLGVSIAATSGVHAPSDVLKLLLVGADVTMVASTLYVHGIEHLQRLLDGTRTWLDDHDYASVEQMKGSLAQDHCPDPSVYERAGYMRTLWSGPTAVR